jgi:hypothetical protein
MAGPAGARPSICSEHPTHRVDCAKPPRRCAVASTPVDHPRVLAVVATPDGWCAVAGHPLRVRPDLLQPFWARMQAGHLITGAVEPLGTSRRTGKRVNGLFRQYFPQGSEPSVHSEEDLDRVAAELDGRPSNGQASRNRSKRSRSSCCDDRMKPQIPCRAPSSNDTINDRALVNHIGPGRRPASLRAGTGGRCFVGRVPRVRSGGPARVERVGARPTPALPSPSDARA